MVRTIFTTTILLALALGRPAHAQTGEKAEILEVRKIWDAGPHNAFTDLIRWHDQWWCTFREAEAHVGGDGKIRVSTSADGNDWQSAALIAEKDIDLRDPKLSITPDGRLMIVCGGSIYLGTTQRKGCQSRVMFSADGREWTTPQPVADRDEWLWRVTWRDGKAYGVVYGVPVAKPASTGAATVSAAPPDEWNVRLITSDDGVKWETVAPLRITGRPNETTLRFAGNGDLHALVRREAGSRKGLFGHARPPYREWTWHELDRRLGGPNFIALPDGTFVAGTRDHTTSRPTTLIARLTVEGLAPLATLPSGGDNSYPGLVWHDGVLWVSYYSSHEGKTSIYLAKLRVPLRESPRAQTQSLPVRGIHLGAPDKKDLAAALELIRDVLPKENVNTLILEFNYSFDYRSRPEFANPRALDKDDVRQIAAACRENGIALIPQINCLGHQSWSKRTGPLLEKHPEFDETPGKYPENKGIYCRSYCPLHPEVHGVMFDLIDELADACEAKAFHVGMDEVFLLADPDCPRCKGKNPADLFAGEVTRLRDHLQSKGRRMWMWGDRFLDGKATGIGEWEASTNGTSAAIDQVPKDIVICDWHYEKAHETQRFFAEKGFDVVACPWRKPNVALGLLANIRAVREGDNQAVAGQALGMVQTTWCGLTSFLAAYKAAEGNKASERKSPAEAAACFRSLFAAIRQGQ